MKRPAAADAGGDKTVKKDAKMEQAAKKEPVTKLEPRWLSGSKDAEAGKGRKTAARAEGEG